MKRSLILLAVAGVAMLLVAASINAGQKCDDAVIEMKNEKAVAQHKMGIVMFTHDKHFAAKPDGHGVGCGECHHDAAGKPLADLKAGDPVQSCFECHSKPDRPKKPQDISDDDWRKMRLEYYVEAIHDNCIVCHKDQGGPVKCTDCHPKPEK